MDPTSAELDLFQPSTLYWKAVPVFLRRSDKDERFQDLTVRVIAGFQRANHSQRVLRVYVSSEADLFFLYVLEVNEDDFAALKLDQGILVDFANFPGKIIGLLEKCIACKEEELPRFQAVLQTHGGQGNFKLVETNDFKQLPHITLLFRAGNDATVKQFLAFRLTELSTDCQQLSQELSKAQSERNVLQTALTETKRQLASTKEQHDKHVLEFEADVKTKEATLLETKSKELNDLREQHVRERADTEKRFQEQLGTAQQRASELDTDNRKLRQQKYDLDAQVSELSHRLGAAEGANRSHSEEVERLRTQVQQLSRDKAERDVEIGEALAKMHALEDKVDTQKEIIAEQADRIRGMEASLRQVEARAEELKAAAQGHDERAKDATNEVVKANTIIEKLSNDLRLLKEKMRRKAAIITRQEEEMQQHEQALEESRQAARGTQRELERVTADADALKRDVEQLKGKLEDSKKQLQGNEQMIRWLNNQITESQLHYPGGASGLPSSRYTFRPSGAAPSTLSAGGAPAGSMVSTGAAHSLSRGISTYRSPANLPTPSSTGVMSGAVGAAGVGATPPTSLGMGSTGATPTSRLSGGAAVASAPGTAGSGGYAGTGFYTSGSSYTGSGGYMRQTAGSGTTGTAQLGAARSLNLGSLSLGGGGAESLAGSAGAPGQQAAPSYRAGDLKSAAPPTAIMQ